MLNVKDENGRTAELKFPTMDEMAKDVARRAVEEIEYNGKTLSEWIDIIAKYQEVNLDCISRKQAIEVVQNRHMMLSKEKVLLINDLEQLPSTQPKRGKWIDKFEETRESLSYCNLCGYPVSYLYKTNFCPNCGADMREVNHESN